MLRAAARVSSRRCTLRSCATKADDVAFDGVDSRRADLHRGLASIGFDEDDVATLLCSEDFRGSAALRSYTSYVFPQSVAAYQATQKPQRAHQTAQVIAHQVREVRAAQRTWLRNHDWAIAEAEHLGRQPLQLVIDNLRSRENVGAIFRAAEAARCAHVHLCGFTAAPPDARVLKTALGAAEYVPHSRSPSTLEAVRKLQRDGVAVWACETTDDAPLHWDLEHPQPLALVLGNESIGVDTAVLDACNAVVQIPCFGVKNSLNVATAASVLMWEALRQWGARPQPPTPAESRAPRSSTTSSSRPSDRTGDRGAREPPSG